MKSEKEGEFGAAVLKGDMERGSLDLAALAGLGVNRFFLLVL